MITISPVTGCPWPTTVSGPRRPLTTQVTGFGWRATPPTSTENTDVEKAVSPRGKASSHDRTFILRRSGRRRIGSAEVVSREAMIPMSAIEMSAVEAAARNKKNYLEAKAAFNRGDLDACMAHYSADHQMRSREAAPGREHIRAFL